MMNCAQYNQKPFCSTCQRVLTVCPFLCDRQEGRNRAKMTITTAAFRQLLFLSRMCVLHKRNTKDTIFQPIRSRKFI